MFFEAVGWSGGISRTMTPLDGCKIADTQSTCKRPEDEQGAYFVTL
jgi:hypothetical protein